MIAATSHPTLSTHHVTCPVSGSRLPKHVKADPRMLEHQHIARQLAQRFVRRMAGQRDFDELFAIAMEGLWKACLQYDAARGAAFASYANTCIYNELEHEQRFVWSQCRRGWLRKATIDTDDDWESSALVSALPSPERAYAAFELAEAVLNSTSPRNRRVLRAVLEDATLGDAGAEADMCGERVRQLFRDACSIVRERVLRREKRLG